MVSEITKRTADSVPAGSMSVWELLRKELTDVPRERPENSITIEEFAAKTGYGPKHAGELLRHNPKLKQIKYRMDTGRPGVCYVPADDPEAA